MEEHRDATLDWCVEAWLAPGPTPDFHARVRESFAREFVKVPWWRVWGFALSWRMGFGLCGTGILGACCVAMVGLAFPQTGGFSLPWLQISGTMDMEEIVYLNDGTPYVTRYLRFVPRAGGKTEVLWNYSPEHPFDNMLDRLRREGLLFVERVTFPEDFDQATGPGDPHRPSAKTGCRLRIPNQTVLREEKLLGYSTIVAQTIYPQYSGRVTAWLAPGLGCRELRSLLEFHQPDGTFIPARETRALAVTP